MQVLLIGGGGREHALAWKIAQSPLLSNLYLCPGGPVFDPLGESFTASPDDLDAITAEARQKAIDLVIVGPEAPLAAGLVDRLTQAGIACFGPTQKAAQLESSKAFAKEICAAAGAPTAAYGRFEEASAAKDFLRSQTAPYVIKADGLAAGKGVVIAETLADGDAAIDDMLGGRFGAAGASIVIEEFMTGEEASFFAITDGERLVPLAAAQDHKRAFDGDEGPNTGGMGAYSPAPIFTPAIEEQTIKQIAQPVIDEMRARGTPYCGVLYVGLMIENGAARVVEFNARFGDPECQILMRRLESDLLPVLFDAAKGTLKQEALAWREDASALVVMAANGYPGSYQKGSIINGIDAANAIDDVVVFHAGTDQKDGKTIANGGRVLNITALGPTLKQAVDKAYQGVHAIDWPEGFYRTDIAHRALK